MILVHIELVLKDTPPELAPGSMLFCRHRQHLAPDDMVGRHIHRSHTLASLRDTLLPRLIMGREDKLTRS
jgi:hypothetical protein